MRAKDPILRNYEGRCPQCYMRQEVCICSAIPDINNKSFLTVIMHHRESFKTTNTARIACMALRNSRILIRGRENQLITPRDIRLQNPIQGSAEYQPLLLTLNERSNVLTTEYMQQFQKPIHLIVPDGNWRQANKMGKREPTLQNVPWVKLLPGPPSVYKLRREHHPEGLATLEAIARALSVIESTEIAASLMTLFVEMVEKTLSTRPPQSAPV